MKKEAVAADAWLKDVAPSANPEVLEPILAAEQRGAVTLLYSAHDVAHNGAVVLREYLLERQAERLGTGKREVHRPLSRTPNAKKSRTMGRTGSSARKPAG